MVTLQRLGRVRKAFGQKGATKRRSDRQLVNSDHGFVDSTDRAAKMPAVPG